MGFSIDKNNKLVSDINKIEYIKTSKKSGRIIPKYLVIHYTAGGGYDSSLKTLTSSDVKASAHLVIGRKGEIAQIEDFATNLWHAGESSWDGIRFLNQCSIGIEVDCPRTRRICKNRKNPFRKA